jgi:hypothetical protein
MMGMPMWLGAKLQPRSSEKSPCWTPTKANAVSGESTPQHRRQIERGVRRYQQALRGRGTISLSEQLLRHSARCSVRNCPLNWHSLDRAAPNFPRPVAPSSECR